MSSWATALCLSFPSVKGPNPCAKQGCAECLPAGLEILTHTFCQAEALVSQEMIHFPLPESLQDSLGSCGVAELHLLLCPEVPPPQAVPQR